MIKDSKFLTEKEVATILKVAPKTLQNWRSKNEGPKFVMLKPRMIRYDLKDIQDWISKGVI